MLRANNETEVINARPLKIMTIKKDTTLARARPFTFDADLLTKINAITKKYDVYCLRIETTYNEKSRSTLILLDENIYYKEQEKMEAEIYDLTKNDANVYIEYKNL